MPGSERQIETQLKDDSARQLRSASPAIKRPASDMGAQDREEHIADVEMGDSGGNSFIPTSNDSQTTSDSKAKQQDTGERHKGREDPERASHTSDPNASRQLPPYQSSGGSTSDSLLPPHSEDSTGATSLEMEVAPTTMNLPSIDEQIAKVTALTEAELVDKQKGYLVSSKWLHRVQARSSYPPENVKVDKSATEGNIGPVNNSDLAMITEDTGKLLDQKGEKYVPIRPGMAMGDDFQVLPQEAWDLVVSWYGLAKGSPVITRYAYDTTSGEGNVPNMQYEMSPPIFSFLKVPCEHTPQTQKQKDAPPVRMLASKSTSFMSWLRQAKELTNIDMSTKVRVWRILGGLKNTSTSGILTPAASRSASPAPGAEVIASAGDRMLLDVNTFAALQLGEHREKLDLNDQTADLKYNGKSTLATVGLGRDEVVVLEEQKGGPAGGEWPSESVRLHLNKTLKDKAKGLTPSGRSSPAPGMTTRGRSRQNRPRGITGLSNLGNTCYMNSALQCIRSVEELTQYFLHDQYKKDLNFDNPLGHRGEIAKAYAALIKQIYEESSSSTNPNRFKTTIGKYGSSFAGYQQQDSQEFLLFLLDGLQEDLNRIQKKPYIEKPDSTDDMVHNRQALKAFADKNWADYKARNDSVITDLFAGMYKSTVTCPVCDKVSIIFDPFNNLTLQLPIENNWAKEVLYFPLHKRPFRIDVDIDKHSSMRGLKEFVSKRTNADPDLLLIAESYKNKIYKVFDNNTVISEANIQNADIICVYELETIPTNYNPNKAKKFQLFSYKEPEDELVDASSPAADKLLVPVYNRLVKSPGSKSTSKPFFALPSYIVLNRKSNKSIDGILKKILGNVAGMTTKDLFEEDSSDDISVTTPEDSDTVLMTDDGSSSGSTLPNAASIQSEDGLVDVSMRDASLAPEPSSESRITETALQPGSPLHPQLKTLFNVVVVSTGEGIPTGWSQITEHNDYEPIQNRVPKTATQSRERNLNVVNGDNDSATSDEELADIEHDDLPAANTASDSDSPIDNGIQQIADSEPEHQDFRSLAKNRNPKGYKMHKRKGRMIPGKLRQAKKTPPPPPPPQPQPQIQGSGIIRPGEAIVLDWTPEAHDALFGGNEEAEDEIRGAPTWKSVELFDDPELAAKRAQRQSRKKNGISLEDCLNEFGKSETLSEANAWYCPRCKEHRRAKKMFELWKAPDILVMHLKRFSSNRNFRDKLEVKVDYPIEDLDLSTMVQDKDDDKPLIYDLISVDNHYGGLGGGHYTAYAKNFVNDSWYEYNDSHVSQREPPAVVTTAAYLLFYRRRSEAPLGGPVLQDLLEETHITEADSEAPKGSREGSPAGEGGRLDDSSHNGSSSVSGAGQVHLVGDGGTATQTRQIHGPFLEGVNPGSLTTADRSEEPPPYSEKDSDHEMMTQDDEGIAGMDYDFAEHLLPWQEPGWGFSKLDATVQHPPSAEERWGERSSNESTRVAGSPNLSDSLLDDDVPESDTALFSEGMTQDEFSSRNMRESAPVPDFVPVVADGMDDDDDDLPVAELKTGDDGEMVVSHAVE